MAAFTIGGGVALAFAMAGSAHADTVSGQAAPVVNAGVGVANSGGNVAVGNASQNSSTCNQGAAGIIAANSCDGGNSSNGTANITTGNASAVGNESSTNVQQHVNGDDGSGDLTVAGQAAPVANVGAAAANTGGNVAVGNASQNTSNVNQGAAGLVASNQADAGNHSDGSATIHTGNATAVGNESATNVDQGVSGGDGLGGLTVAGQFAPVINAGVGLANTGLNLAAGNVSPNNTSTCNQGALGLVAFNACDAGNTSDGTANITTGNATGIGNQSSTMVEQGVWTDPGGLAVVGQLAPVANVGLGLANSGVNFAVANDSMEQEILNQVALGLLAANVGSPFGWSNGSATILTGTGTAIGSQSSTIIKQHA